MNLQSSHIELKQHTYCPHRVNVLHHWLSWNILIWIWWNKYTKYKYPVATLADNVD